MLFVTPRRLNRSFAALALALPFALIAAMPAQADDAAAKPEKPKKVCRRMESTGSYLPRIVCHTSAEWADIEKQTATDTERQLNGINRTGSPGAAQ